MARLNWKEVVSVAQARSNQLVLASGDIITGRFMVTLLSPAANVPNLSIEVWDKPIMLLQGKAISTVEGMTTDLPMVAKYRTMGFDVGDAFKILDVQDRKSTKVVSCYQHPTSAIAYSLWVEVSSE